MLDTIVSNMWIIHSDLNFMVLQELLTHMAFQLQFAKDLESKWGGKKHGYSTFALYRPTAHGPKSMGKNRASAKFVVSGQIKLVRGSKFIFAKEVAIGITTDRNFYEDNGVHYC